MMKYLKQLTDCQELNQNLIHGYRKYCNGEWSTYPGEDYYYYQYLIHHVIQAKDDETIEKIMRDFNWMSLKIQLDKTIYNLCTDMEMAIDYFKEKDKKVMYFVWISIFCSIVLRIDQHLKLDIIF